MSRVCLVAIVLFLTACSIPPEFIRADGVLVVEVTGHETFRVGDHMYTTGALEVAMERLSKSPALKRVELYIPSKMAHQTGFSCQSYAVAILASGKEWQFYEWTPGQPETKAPTKCDYAVLS